MSAKDILLTPEEARLWQTCMIHTIMRIAVKHGGPELAKLAAKIQAILPSTADRIPVHKTETYPLPAMNIDESSSTGNADVADTMYTEMLHDFQI